MGILQLKKIENYDYFFPILESILARVKALEPQSMVFLFGSAARQEMTEKSDLDLVVIIPDTWSIKDFSEKLRKDGPLSPQWPLDLVVLNQSRYQQRKNFGGVCVSIASEGIELYPHWRWHVTRQS